MVSLIIILKVKKNEYEFLHNAFQKTREVWTLANSFYNISITIEQIKDKKSTIEKWCIEQALDSVGEGEGGKIWENGIN